MPIKLEVQTNTGDVMAGTGPFTQNGIVIWDPATGPKTVQDSDLTAAAGTIDHKTAAGTINIGSTNAAAINIGGRANAIINIGSNAQAVNILGSLTYEQVTNLQVADKLITINKGGGVGSATATGLEFEENALITGYIKTSADRNSFELLAPNTAGILTITPGAANFTLDNTVVKSTSGAVTDNVVARYDLTTGVLIQDSAVVIDDTNNMSGIVDLTCTGNLVTGAAGSATFNTTLTGVAKLTAGVLSVSNVALGSEISGTLPIANGGTGQTAKQAAFDALSPVTTQGDLIVRDASNNVRLALGTQYHVLQAGATDPAYGLITNNNIDASAAIAYSKINFNGSIDNDDIAATTVANIAWNKLAAGTANYPMITDASGYPTTEQYLDKTRGGTGITSTATFPATGTITTGTGTQNDIVKWGASNTIVDAGIKDDGTDVTIERNKLLIGDNADTDKVIEADNSDANNPALRYNATGNAWEYSNDGVIFNEIGSGGASGINYITNSDAEANNVTGWVTYADAAGSVPVDGTGGAPTVTFAANGTTPLRGSYDFVFTKDAADRQGEGVSYVFDIDPADIHSVMEISFDCTTSANYADDDMIVYIYNTDSSRLIEPVPMQIKAGEYGKYYAQFQTDDTDNSYRLIFHVSSTNASAYTVNFDNIKVGPPTRNFGAPVTDIIWTPTLDASTTTPTLGSSSIQEATAIRIGSFLFANVKIRFGSSGTNAGSGTYYIELPNSLQADVTDQATSFVVGSGYVRDDGTAANNRDICAEVVVSSPQYIQFRDYDEDSNLVTHSSPFSWAASDYLECTFKVKIAGWGSSVQMSDSDETRVVAASYSTTTAHSMANNSTIIVTFDVTDFDTHSAVSYTDHATQDWKYTAPVGGIYNINAHVFLDSSADWDVDEVTQAYVYKNGVQYQQVHRYEVHSSDQSALYESISGNITLELSKGDYVDFRVFQNSGNARTINPGSGTYFNIHRLSGPSAIAANELVAAKYDTDAGQSIDNDSYEIVNFDSTTFGYDTHGAVNTGAAWKFTAPVSGKYNVSTQVTFDQLTLDAGEVAFINLYKNGVLENRLDYHKAVAATDVGMPLNGNVDIDLIAGDYIDIRVYQCSGGAEALEATEEATYISIHRIGF